MDDKKYILVEPIERWIIEIMGKKVRNFKQIQAVRDIYRDGKLIVKAGELGGFVEGEHNLSQEGSCWIADAAHVFGNAKIYQNAYIGGHSIIWGNAQVYGNAIVGPEYGNLQNYICGNVEILDNTIISGGCVVQGNTKLTGHHYYRRVDDLWAIIKGNKQIYWLQDCFLLDMKFDSAFVTLAEMKKSEAERSL